MIHRTPVSEAGGLWVVHILRICCSVWSRWLTTASASQLRVSTSFVSKVISRREMTGETTARARGSGRGQDWPTIMRHCDGGWRRCWTRRLRRCVCGCSTGMACRSAPAVRLDAAPVDVDAQKSTTGRRAGAHLAITFSRPPPPLSTVPVTKAFEGTWP